MIYKEKTIFFSSLIILQNGTSGQSGKSDSTCFPHRRVQKRKLNDQFETKLFCALSACSKTVKLNYYLKHRLGSQQLDTPPESEMVQDFPWL